MKINKLLIIALLLIFTVSIAVVYSDSTIFTNKDDTESVKVITKDKVPKLLNEKYKNNLNNELKNKVQNKEKLMIIETTGKDVKTYNINYDPLTEQNSTDKVQIRKIIHVIELPDGARSEVYEIEDVIV